MLKKLRKTGKGCKMKGIGVFGVSRKFVRGFTLVELLVVISIIALLLAVLMPVLGKAREQARMVICKTNLATIGKAEKVYANCYGDRMAPNRDDRLIGDNKMQVIYWAAKIWSNFDRVKIPAWSDTSVQPIYGPKWFNCPTEKHFPLSLTPADSTNDHTWSDVHLANGTGWLQGLCYARAGTGQGNYQINPLVPFTPCFSVASIKSPATQVGAADGEFILFDADPLRSNKYRAKGKVMGPYRGNGSGPINQLVVRYRHRSRADTANILLWDGHVASVVNSIVGNGYLLDVSGRWITYPPPPGP
ncbi:MAG: type II secretion system protein [Sedimentisphaerales bacterium]